MIWSQTLASVTGEEPGIEINSEWKWGRLLRDPPHGFGL